MAIAKVNASLWNSLSEEDKNKIIQHFSSDTDYDIESIEPDQNVPIPNPKTLIYGASTREIRKLIKFEDELIVKLKMDTKKADKFFACINNFDGTAFLLCVSIIAQENIKPSLSEGDDLVNYRSIADRISNRSLGKKHKEIEITPYGVSIENAAFLKLLPVLIDESTEIPVLVESTERDKTKKTLIRKKIIRYKAFSYDKPLCWIGSGWWCRICCMRCPYDGNPLEY